MKRKLTEYTFRSEKITEQLRFAVVSDIHSAPFEDVLEEFSRCDAVLLPGDLVDRHRRDNTDAERFLQVVPKIRPLFYSIGNHERKYRHREAFLARARENGAILLDNGSTDFRGVRIGGLKESLIVHKGNPVPAGALVLDGGNGRPLRRN